MGVRKKASQSRLPQSPPYTPPTTVFLSRLPAASVPYFELGRVEQFKGTLLTTLRCTAGSLFAACVHPPDPASQPPPPVGRVLQTNLWLLFLTILLDAVGCAWNDLVDRDLDRQVARCRNRPIARGAVSVRGALAFVVGLYALVFAMLRGGIPAGSVAESSTALWTLLFIATGTVYPFAKRVTYYAQVVLGVCYCLCVPLGCAAMGVAPGRLFLGPGGGLRVTPEGAALICLMASCLVWTVIIDMIYAFQDLKDDKKAGIKAMTVRFEMSYRPVLYALAALKGALLFVTGWLIGAHSASFYYSSCFLTSLSLASGINKMDLKDPKCLLWWFENGGLICYGILCLGFLSEYLQRVHG